MNYQADQEELENRRFLKHVLKPLLNVVISEEELIKCVDLLMKLADEPLSEEEWEKIDPKISEVVHKFHLCATEALQLTRTSPN